MAYNTTGYGDVPGVQHVECLQYKVKAADAVTINAACAWHTVAGQVTSTTTGTSGMCAGLARESCTGAEATAGCRIELQVHGVARYICGDNDLSSQIGSFLMLEAGQTDGKFENATAASQVLIITHGVNLSGPDSDGDIGFMLLNLNVPYYIAVT